MDKYLIIKLNNVSDKEITVSVNKKGEELFTFLVSDKQLFTKQEFLDYCHNSVDSSIEVLEK